MKQPSGVKILVKHLLEVPWEIALWYIENGETFNKENLLNLRTVTALKQKPTSTSSKAVNQMICFSREGQQAEPWDFSALFYQQRLYLLLSCNLLSYNTEHKFYVP